jgi:hypothetical protein
MPNPFAVSRQLVEAGMDPKHAEAIAEALVVQAKNQPLSKADLLKAKMELEDRIVKIVKREVETAIARGK